MVGNIVFYYLLWEAISYKHPITHHYKNMSFGTLLRKHRIEKGLSQSQISEQVGIEQSTYSRIESDMLEPRAGILMKLARYYQIDIGKLYPPPP